jgi:hypothetical protein
MKQTAVEWLADKIDDIIMESLRERVDLLKEQAKEMEKEQIIEAWIVSDNPLQRMEAEKYYNTTYKQD